MKIKDFLLCFFLVALVLVLFSCSYESRMSDLSIENFPERTRDFSFWQLDQFYGESQMGYILRTDDNRIVIIDGGLDISANILENILKQLGGIVDTWVITHPHKDHIGALCEIIQGGEIKINRLVHSAIDEDMVQIHEPRSFTLIQEYYKILKNSKINVLDALQGTTFSIGEGIELKVLGAQNSNILENFVNNSSLVFMIRSKTKSVLFLGDLGVEGGKVVLENFSPEEIKADYVQIAHHGQGGVNKDFYEVVDAQYALWPTPDWLWDNNMEAKGKNSGTWDTFTVRKWMKDLNVKKNYVAGLEGTIQID